MHIILFHSVYVHSNKAASLNNYLPGPTSLGESNNPMPLNCGEFSPNL